MSTDSTPRKRFGRALRDLLDEKGLGFASKLGNADPGFSRKPASTHYEVLRTAVSGARQPSPSVMEDCARQLGVSHQKVPP